LNTVCHSQFPKNFSQAFRYGSPTPYLLLTGKLMGGGWMGMIFKKAKIGIFDGLSG